ncbi:hypothetical protein AQPE_4757 [Aquipluma nitroreducens]|uniref:Uncharacterized protein n=1 Tax=Aquipluma nitroreducens TaxID=2010828 RepID=A0A5K7SG87_9BACT|nr:hypothetical protein AQPE_4757 [Aquipluma nitroreducens]
MEKFTIPHQNYSCRFILNILENNMTDQSETKQKKLLLSHEISGNQQTTISFLIIEISI